MPASKTSRTPRAPGDGAARATPRKPAVEHTEPPPTRAPAAVIDLTVRRRGRPSKAAAQAQAGGAAVLTREQILDCAARMARTEPLGEISMVGLARELGVAPTLIHYYIGSRDDLISGVVNRYFKERVLRAQPFTGDWKADLRREATLTYNIGVEHGGVVRYAMSHNRFRLFQRVSAGEVDYGVVYFDRIGTLLRSAGFSPGQVATAYHLLSLYVMSSSYAEVSRQLPAYHEGFIREQITTHAPAEMTGAHYFADAFAALDSATAFPIGLDFLIDSFERWLPAGGATTDGSPARKTSKRPRA